MAIVYIANLFCDGDAQGRGVFLGLRVRSTDGRGVCATSRSIYVECQFKLIGLKPAGVEGYR